MRDTALKAPGTQWLKNRLVILARTGCCPVSERTITLNLDSRFSMLSPPSILLICRYSSTTACMKDYICALQTAESERMVLVEDANMLFQSLT